MSNATEPLFPRLQDIAALGGGINDSMTSLCSEAEREELAMTWQGLGQRQTSTMSNYSTTSSTVLSASKKRKKKASVWAEKYETTAVVFGPLDNHELFKQLVMDIKSNVGEVKSHYYREEQLCGFVYFHIEDFADDCKHRYNKAMFQGRTLRACSPSQFFKNEEDAFPDPTRRRPQLSAQLSTLSIASTCTSSEPTATLVIKNLCFGLKQQKLLDFMSNLKVPPQSVSYHYDNNGLFRGVAFAKYQSGDAAEKSLKELEDAELGGRKLRVEFKRRTSAMPGGSPLRQKSFDASMLSPMKMPAQMLSPVRSQSFKPLLSPSRVVPQERPSTGLLRTPESARVVHQLTPIKHAAPMPSHSKAASPIVIREGMEFADIVPNQDSFLVSGPPPVCSLKVDKVAVPILRAGMEFA